MKKIYLMLLFISIINIAQLKAADNFTNRHRPIRLKMQNGHFNKPTQAKSDVKSKPIAVEYGLPKSILGKYFTDSMYTYSFKSLSDSLLTGKDYEKYDANGLTSVSYILDTNTNKWLVDSKTEINIDVNGNSPLYINYKWDAITKNWVNFNEDQSYFNMDGKDTMDASSTWNPSTKLWVINHKQVYKLNMNGIDTLSIQYDLDTITNKLVANFKQVYTLDAKGNKTLETDYNIDPTTKKWIAESKYEYAFDASGNDTLTIYSYINSMTNQWVAESKYESVYDANSKKILEIDYYFDQTTNLWVYNSKQKSTYDPNGNQTSNIDYNWNSGQWVIDNEDKTAFGSNGFPTMDSYYSMNQANQLALTEKDYYIFYNVTVDINPVKTGLVSFYPNPANSILNLEISENAASQCQIYNSNGQLISTYLLKQGNNTINVSNLIAGLYIIKIQTQKETITSKLIKQ